MSLRLHKTIAAVCPILGVYDSGDNATSNFRVHPSATAEQIAAAVAALASYDRSQAAEDDFEANLVPERKDLRDNAVVAVQALNDYLTIADTATQAVVRAQVKLLSQIMKKVIVRLVQLD